MWNPRHEKQMDVILHTPALASHEFLQKKPVSLMQSVNRILVLLSSITATWTGEEKMQRINNFLLKKRMPRILTLRILEALEKILTRMINSYNEVHIDK